MPLGAWDVIRTIKITIIITIIIIAIIIAIIIVLHIYIYICIYIYIYIYIYINAIGGRGPAPPAGTYILCCIISCITACNYVTLYKLDATRMIPYDIIS